MRTGLFPRPFEAYSHRLFVCQGRPTSTQCLVSVTAVTGLLRHAPSLDRLSNVTNVTQSHSCLELVGIRSDTAQVGIHSDTAHASHLRYQNVFPPCDLSQEYIRIGISSNRRKKLP